MQKSMLARRCKKAFYVGKFLNSISSNYYNIQKIDSCALIKVKETEQINNYLYVEKIFKSCAILQKSAQCKLQLHNFSPKGPFSSPLYTHITTCGTPFSMKHKDPLYLPRYNLIGLIQQIGSYLETIKLC